MGMAHAMQMNIYCGKRQNCLVKFFLKTVKIVNDFEHAIRALKMFFMFE